MIGRSAAREPLPHHLRVSLRTCYAARAGL